MDTLIFNRAFAKFYALAKMQPVYSRTYTITEAKKLLIDFSRSKFTDPKNKEPFLELALSFASYEARALTFTMEQDSLEFLFDDKEKRARVDWTGPRYTSTESLNKLTGNAKQHLFNDAIQTFYYFGVLYQKVVINSGYRTPNWQANYFVNNTDKWRKYKREVQELLKFSWQLYEGEVSQKHLQKVVQDKIKDDPLWKTCQNLNNSSLLLSNLYLYRIKVGDITLLAQVLEDIFTAKLVLGSTHLNASTVDLDANNSGKYIYEKHSGKKYEESGFKHIEY